MKEDISKVSSEKLLQLAEERIFSFGPRDLASALSYKNMCYGLGKIIYVLQGDAYCVFGPDATITRNKGRWLSGFGYGGVIRWCGDNIAFPEIRPNACGMLLMRLNNFSSKEDLIRKASEVEEKEITLDGIEINPDFGKGNHFFEIYEPLEVSEDVSDVFPEDAYFAILHGSAPELKDNMYSWEGKGERVETPLGDITVLYDDEAEKYYKEWSYLESFSKRRREILAREVVGEHEAISNLTHQGLFSKNEARLGCYDSMEGNGDVLFPISLRWDIPTYVFKGKQNLTDKIIHRLGFYERAERLDLLEELKNVNILPHGGGYDLKLPYGEIEIISTSFGNIFALSGLEPAPDVSEISIGKGVSKFGEMVVTDPKSLPYTYRGKRVIGKTNELELGEMRAKLRPILTIKV